MRISAAGLYRMPIVSFRIASLPFLRARYIHDIFSTSALSANSRVFLREDTRSAVWCRSSPLARMPALTVHSVPLRTPGRDPRWDPVHTLTISARRDMMLRWALGFFVVALIAAVLGFTGIAVAAAGVAKVLFFLFVVLFLITLLGHVARRP